MKKVRPFSQGTRQFLTFTGPGWHTTEVGTGRGLHPVIRSTPCAFLNVRFPKLVAINGNEQAAYRKAMAS